MGMIINKDKQNDFLLRFIFTPLTKYAKILYYRPIKRFLMAVIRSRTVLIIMSMQFLPFDRDAAAIVAPYFHARGDRFCDRTVGVNYMWRVPFDGSYTITDGCLILRVSYGEKGIHFTFPVGENPGAALTSLEQYCRENGLPLRFAAVSEQEITALRERYSHITVTTNRDFSDYLYYYDDLATFAGRRYSAQRNHINKFIKLHPDWAYRPLTREDVPTVQAFLQNYIARKSANEPLSRSELTELRGCTDLLEAMHDFEMHGGMITVGGNVVAFAIGETLGDTLYVHCEKGDVRYAGVYQLMVREFAAHNAAPHLHYINREDDAGDTGLRQSKLAYRPCALLEKGIAVINEEKE